MSFVKAVIGRIRNFSYPDWLLWFLAGGVLILTSFHIILRTSWFDSLPTYYRAMILVGILVAVGLVIFLGIQTRDLFNQRKSLLARVDRVENIAAKANQRLEAVFRLSQKFVEANDEKEVNQLVLGLCVDLVGALGASIVPIDERGQPLTAINYGDLTTSVINDWVEYLASPAVRHDCGTCQDHQSLTNACPLLKNPFIDSVELYCLPLKRGEHEFGVLNLYLPKDKEVDEDTRAFLRAMVDETAIALESIRLRKRELETLRHLKAVRRRSDLADLITNFLEDFRSTLKADFILLVLAESDKRESSLSLMLGDYPSQDRSFLDGLIQGVVASGQPIIFGDVDSGINSPQFLRSLMIVPLTDQGEAPIGTLVCGSLKDHSFNQRHLALLKTVSGQVVLVVQNAQLMAELEYKTMMAERTRLAREIHDGLAQTLGFLKLQTAQMQNYLDQGEVERLQQSIRSNYETLADAYLEARTAIDGLRINSLEEGLGSWLEQTAIEFQENSGLPVEFTRLDSTEGLPSEVQAQLIRIAQESLSNIRKHAQATQVWISCRELGGELLMEIRDNGRGFTPDDVPIPSRHGLQGIRERTELIGAEFQIISYPQEGTTVRVRIPLLGEEVLE